MREREVFRDFPNSGISVPISRDNESLAERRRLKVSDDGMNLWSVVAGEQGDIQSVIGGVLSDVYEEGSAKVAAANLKALAEIQCILRATPVGADWEDPVVVPAGDLVLLVRMAMRRLS